MKNWFSLRILLLVRLLQLQHIPSWLLIKLEWREIFLKGRETINQDFRPDSIGVGTPIYLDLVITFVYELDLRNILHIPFENKCKHSQSKILFLLFILRKTNTNAIIILITHCHSS